MYLGADRRSNARLMLRAANIFFSYAFERRSMSRARNERGKSALTVLRQPLLHRGIRTPHLRSRHKNFFDGRMAALGGLKMRRQMKWVLAAVALLGLAAATGATAADLPVKAPRAAPVPLYNWS